MDTKPRNKALYLANFIPYVESELKFGTAQHDISELFYIVIDKIDSERKFIHPGDIMTIKCVELFECLKSQCKYSGPTEASLALSVKFDSDCYLLLEELIISQQRKQCNSEHVCSICGSKGTYSSRVFTLVSKYLNVYVRRVLFTEGSNAGVKKQTAVEFDERLVITVTLQDGSTTYKTFSLIGLIMHIGSQASAGHYVCFIKSDAQWILHDDDKVFLVNRECIFRDYTYKNVYLLSYRLNLE